MYTHFDKIEYIVLPIEIQTKISKLIFKSLNASGKEFSNSYYRNEFTIIKEYIKKEELTLF
jgi:hypothetical protein